MSSQSLSPQIHPAFFQYLERSMRHNFLKDTSCEISTRRTLQVAAIGVAVLAQTGMASLNIDAAEGNPALEVILPACNMTSFGAFYIYCSWTLLNQAFRNLSPEEKALMRAEIPGWIRSLLKAAAAFVGTISQAPLAYAVYNGSKVSLAFSIARFLDAGLPIRSLYLGGKALVSSRCLGETQKKLEEARNYFVALIREKQQILLSQTPQVIEFLDKLENEHKRSVSEYLNAILQLSQTSVISETDLEKGIKKVALLSSHGANLFVMWIYGAITVDAINSLEELTGMSKELALFLKVITVALIVCSKFYLWKESVTHAGTSVVTDVKRLMGHPTPKTIAQTFMPKADAAGTVTAYGVGALSYGSMKYFCNLYGYGNGGTVVAALATALMGKYTLNNLKKGLIEEKLSKWGNPQQKRVIRFHRELENIARTAEESCRIEWAKFLLWLPKNIRPLIIQNGLTNEEIIAFLSTKKEQGFSINNKTQLDADSLIQPLLTIEAENNYGSGEIRVISNS